MNSDRINFDISCFTEIWLSEETNNMLTVNNYNSFLCVRRGTGGGVRVYVIKDYYCEILSNYTVCLDFMESIFLRVNRNGHQIHNLISLLINYILCCLR